MTATLAKPLTFDAFVAEYGDNFRYELADGELVDMEPTGTHEAVGGKIAAQISGAIAAANLPWVIPRTCLIRPFSVTSQQMRGVLTLSCYMPARIR